MAPFTRVKFASLSTRMSRALARSDCLYLTLCQVMAADESVACRSTSLEIELRCVPNASRCCLRT